MKTRVASTPPERNVRCGSTLPITSLDNPVRAMATRFVRCIDNTLANDVLSVGEIYEVMHINERDGYYALSGLGQFTMARFQLVPLRRQTTVDAIEA